MTTDARIGSELAGYRIEVPIGRGGMGVVYRAEQLRLGRKVALKLLAPELAENQGFRARFEHESRLAAALDHPNIVPLFEAGEADGLLFISMRYVEGTDLRALVSKHGRLEPERALAIAAQVASALDAAHMRGLVHRDVKPGNILIAEGAAPGVPEHCYLTDFGLTKDTSSPVELTATGTFVGTIDYIAPEQIEGAKPDGRGDQYALACVLFECLTGHPPFPRDEEISVMWAHLQDEPPTVTADCPQLPPAIDAVIAQALSKAPQARYATCSAMVAAARAALLPEAPVVAPAATTREHASPVAPPPAGATRVNAANAAPALAAAAAPAGAAAAPPLAAPTAADWPAERAPATEQGSREPAPTAHTAIRPRWPVIAGVAALMLVVAVAGYLAGQSGDETPAASKLASNGDLSVAYNANWTRGGRPDAVRGLELVSPVTLQSGAARIVAGRIAHPGPGLLPVGVGAPSATGVVTLDRTPALRHTDVPAGAHATATVFVVSTDDGPEAIACVGASPKGCEGVAATLKMKTGNALDIRPSKAYATALTALLADHTRREAADRRALARAGTSATQAAAAARASRAQAALAKRARDLPAPQAAGAANEAVAAAIAGSATGYKRIAAAARAHDAAAYRRAGGALRRAQERLTATTGALELLGYRVAADA
jgi:protein kinase-like protein